MLFTIKTNTNTVKEEVFQDIVRVVSLGFSKIATYMILWKKQLETSNTVINLKEETYKYLSWLSTSGPVRRF
jgi:hypothetical protein